MKLFLNDIPVFIKKREKVKNFLNYDVIVNGSNKNIYVGMLLGQVLVNNASIDQLTRVFRLMSRKRLQKLKSMTLVIEDRAAVKAYIKKNFKIVKAGGGVVYRDGAILMIHRLNRWDLPKGKLEKAEQWAEGAAREVEEECNIKVEVRDRICATWHNYSMNGKKILKRTEWFSMECLDDSQMKPQISEDIQEVTWKKGRGLKEAMYSTYTSVRYVIEQFQSQAAKAKEANTAKS